MSIFYPPAEFNKVSLCVKIDNESFYASGKVCTKLGYLQILKQNANEEKEENLDVFKELKKGQKIKVENFEIKDAETSPPSRYNSGSMILAMENAGKLIED